MADMDCGAAIRSDHFQAAGATDARANRCLYNALAIKSGPAQGQVDPCHFRQQLGDVIVREQLAFADVVVMNKADLVAEESPELLRLAIRALNRAAVAITATNSQVPTDPLLGVRRFSLATLSNSSCSATPLTITNTTLRSSHAR
jgi:G3E family GTPase